jgi:DnaJ-class molecular chaperone
MVKPKVMFVSANFFKKIAQKRENCLHLANRGIADRFATESLAQHQIAEKKFTEIQRAYEVLERR